jgi:hypothetical protein
MVLKTPEAVLSWMWQAVLSWTLFPHGSSSSHACLQIGLGIWLDGEMFSGLYICSFVAWNLAAAAVGATNV